MGKQASSHQKKKFNTELTDYSEVHNENTGPYANDLEVDALVVGGGFGKVYPTILHFHVLLIYLSPRRRLHAQDPP